MRIFYLVLLASLVNTALAESPPPRAAPGTLAACLPYQAAMTRSARSIFGPGAPIATLVGQLHQESGCRDSVGSWVGAQGLAQFMPGTASDMAKWYPRDCAPANPLSAAWALKCRDRYMKRLMSNITAATESDLWAMTLSAYNGGLGWLYRDKRRCLNSVMLYDRECSASLWWWNVELTPDPRRADWAVRENRHYPYRIICELSPRYESSGWGRAIACGKGESP